jgi:hypothetical protein
MPISRENDFVRFVYDHEQRLLLATVKPCVPTEDQWQFAKTAVNGFYTSALATETKFAIVLDFRQLQLLPISRYADWANFFNELKPKTAVCVHKTAIVTDSVFVRTALNAFFSLYTTVRPTSFVSTHAEALSFVHDQTEKAPEATSVGANAEAVESQ